MRGVEEILNLQPREGKAKSYQVKQVRNIILKYDLRIGEQIWIPNTKSSFFGVRKIRHIAEVPELPGCMADGETYQKALSSAEQIIQEWIETARELGRSIPEPKGRLAYA